MKKILLLLSALTLSLVACAPVATTSLPTSVPAVADALRVPHLTLKALTVTVHNPTTMALTGDASRGMRPVVTVLTTGAKPADGSTCTRAATIDVRWNCPVADVAAGGTSDLVFVPDAPGAKASVDFAFGTGYLGNAVVVPLVLLR